MDKKIQVKYFLGATIDDMYIISNHYWKFPIINITVNEPFKVVLGKLLDLKKFKSSKLTLPFLI